MKIVALDPGGTTGVATYLRDVATGAEEWWTQHLGPEEHHAELWTYMSHLFLPFSGQQFIVCESFEFRQNRQRDNINLMSKEYIGVVKLFGKTHGIPVVFQTAALGKGFVNDDKLKIMGRYEAGRRHSNDAMRHLIYYMVNKQKRHDLIESWKNL